MKKHTYFKILVTLIFGMLYCLPVMVYNTFNPFKWSAHFTADTGITFFVAYLLWFFFFEIEAFLNKYFPLTSNEEQDEQ